MAVDRYVANWTCNVNQGFSQSASVYICLEDRKQMNHIYMTNNGYDGMLCNGLGFSISGIGRSNVAQNWTVLFHGTPKEVGTYQVWITYDSNSLSRIFKYIWQIKVINPVIIRKMTRQRDLRPSIPDVKNYTDTPTSFQKKIRTAKEYSWQIETEGAQPITYSLKAGALPPGFTLGSSGLISGQCNRI